MTQTRDAKPISTYDLERVVGRGGMAVVWLARHQRGAPVALKFATTARTPALRRAFRREAQSASSLSHPSIIQVLDFGRVRQDAPPDGEILPGAPWMALEWVPEGHLDAGDITDWPTMRSYLLQVLAALAHAHAHGIIHRDIKPENILGSVEGGIRLTDFGIAGIADIRAADLDHLVGPTAGTPWTMAPEQFAGATRAFGPWTDIYGLGCVAWKFITGSPPFVASNVMGLAMAHTHDELPPWLPRFEVPDGVEGWLRRCLAKQTLARFRDAAGARQQLRAVESSAMVRLPGSPGFTEASADSPTLPFFTHTCVATTKELVRVPDELTPGAGATPPHDPIPPLSDWRELEVQFVGGHHLASASLLPLRNLRTIGREPERDQLWQAFGGVISQGGLRTVVLTGPRGVGKSHLAEWMVAAAHESVGAKCAVATHALHPGPDEGIAGMVRRYVRCHNLTQEKVAQRLDSVMRQFGARDERLVSGLATTLAGGGVSAVQIPPQERARLFRRFIALTLWAWTRPGVLVLDDCVLSRDAMLFLRELHETLEEVPLLLIVTADDEDLATRATETVELTRIGEQRHVRWLPVAPMSRQSHRALMAELAVSEHAAADRIFRWSSGLPFNTVSLAHDAAARGAVEPDGVHLAVRLDEPTFPSEDRSRWWRRRVQRALASGGLDEADFQVVALAAILGARVVFAEWELAVEHLTIDISLDDVLDALVEAGLAHHGDEVWRFAHRSVVNELIESTTAEERAALHQAAIVAIGARYAGKNVRPWDRLARHYEALGDLDQTLFALRKTAESLVGSGRRADIEMVADRVARLTAHLSGDDPRAHLATLLRMRSRIHYLRKLDELEPVRKILERATSEGWPEVELLAREILGVTLSTFNRFAEAAEQYERALAVCDLERDTTMAARLIHGQGIELGRRGQPERARKKLQRARELAEQCGDHARVAAVALMLSELDVAAGELDRAEARVREAIPKMMATSATIVLADAYNELGEIARFRGDYEAALAHYDQAKFFYTEAKGLDIHIPQFNGAMVSLTLGRDQEALEELKRLAAHYAARNLSFDLGTAQLAAAVAQLRLGQVSQVELAQTCEEVQALLDEAGCETDLGLLWQWLAEAALARGWAEMARHCAQESLKIWRVLQHVEGQGRLEKLLDDLNGQLSTTDPGQKVP